MLVKFKQAVRLPPGPKGRDYSRGVHDVPVEALKHPFFLKLVNAGLVEDGEAAAAVASTSAKSRQQHLMDRVLAPAKKVSDPDLHQDRSPGESEEPADPAPEAPPASSESTDEDKLAAEHAKAVLAKAEQARKDDEELKKMEAEEAAEKAKAEKLKAASPKKKQSKR